MKFQSSNTRLIVDLTFDESKPNKRYKCPESSCSQSKRKNPLDLQYYPKSNTAYCHKCETTFFKYEPHGQKQYVVPEWKNITQLSDKGVKFFNSRMISDKTLNKMKIYTDNEWMPQFEKKVETICFPFFVNEKLINTKFRAAKKTFKLITGAELVWYNYDALLNNKEIIITEGEMDCLSFIECGFDNCISVPNGANNNLEYLDNTIGLFDNIEKIYLATDNDTKGLELRNELIRRLGAEKCLLINFKQHKDANDYFIYEGGLELKKTISEAKAVPINGVVKIDSFEKDIIDLYENGIKPGVSIGEPEMDKYCTWELGRLCVVSGRPSSGKSEVVDYIITRLNLKHGWKAAYFTPENYPLKYHYAKIHEKFSGCKFKKDKDTTDFYSIYEYVKDNFYYILDEDDMSIDGILKAAKSFVKQYGVKVLTIDPYNVIEHRVPKGMNQTDYISDFLGKITQFARYNNVLIFLIAHPTKLDNGQIPTLYNISGSAHFYNKTDYGFVVSRKSDENNLMTSEVDIYWQKIKFRHLGEQGVSEMIFNYNNGRYEDRNSIGVDNWDNSNWIVSPTKNIKNEEIETNTDFWENIQERNVDF